MNVISLCFAVISALLCLSSVISAVPIKLSESGDACKNAQDLAVFNKTWTTFHATFQDCASGCWAAEDCTTQCAMKKLGLSKPCATCFADDAQCTLKNCAWDCIKPSSAECVACSKKNCLPALVDCSGIPADKLPQ
eukprot:TRINITY_DN3859_c0_g2_i1.p1 TRINITY_DN3859_c0_g2~~TRINITY_DN3859_c0_g2_i1.p1  ORF type:complete len:136 (-),score=9.23 TRINITY_DN3859_c0_g2_i1:56-463(-)